MYVKYGGLWGLEIDDAQYAAGRAVAEQADSTRYKIWRALMDAGCPVRDSKGKTVASLAATAIENMVFYERVKAA